MNYQSITRFFMWNTIINGSILIVWTIILMIFGNGVFEIHNKMLSISQEYFYTIMYGLIGLFKIIIIVFNVVPWIALSILKKMPNDNLD